MDINQWISQNRLKTDWIDDNLFKINDELYYVIQSKKIEFDDNTERDIVINQRFEFQYTEDEITFIRDNEIKYVVFKFGSYYYYSEPFDIKLNIFKYIGQTNEDLKIDFPYLGIHGGYELCNGSRNYEDWIRKAKFCGYTTLGLCEENTLAGTLAFQGAMEKAKINFILGETVTVLFEGSRFNIKLYVLNEEGWQSLLRINNYINCNIVNEVVDKFIPFEQLHLYTEGLVCVLTPEVELSDEILNKFKIFKDLYYQLDFVAWNSNDRDYSWLMNLKLYFELFINKLPPIIISDAYYLDKEDSRVKKYLNKIGNIGFKPQSNDQYFKSSDDIYLQMSLLFKSSDERVFNFFLDGIENTKVLVNKAEGFKIKTGNLYLPQYQMTDEEGSRFKNNEDLFFSLIEEGFNKKLAGKVDEVIYWERIEKEIEVIKEGGFIDYFLIIADIFNWCRNKGYWVGLGRGCFLPNENFVTLSSGEKRKIEEVEIGDRVKNYFNVETEVTEIHEYEIQEEIVELEFEEGRIVKCTKDHKILTGNRGWVEAQFLTEEDNIVSVENFI